MLSRPPSATCTIYLFVSILALYRFLSLSTKAQQIVILSLGCNRGSNNLLLVVHSSKNCKLNVHNFINRIRKCVLYAPCQQKKFGAKRFAFGRMSSSSAYLFCAFLLPTTRSQTFRFVFKNYLF